MCHQRILRKATLNIFLLFFLQDNINQNQQI